MFIFSSFVFVLIKSLNATRKMTHWWVYHFVAINRQERFVEKKKNTVPVCGKEQRTE